MKHITAADVAICCRRCCFSAALLPRQHASGCSLFRIGNCCCSSTSKVGERPTIKKTFKYTQQGRPEVPNSTAFLSLLISRAAREQLASRPSGIPFLSACREGSYRSVSVGRRGTPNRSPWVRDIGYWIFFGVVHTIWRIDLGYRVLVIVELTDWLLCRGTLNPLTLPPSPPVWRSSLPVNIPTRPELNQQQRSQRAGHL